VRIFALLVFMFRLLRVRGFPIHYDLTRASFWNLVYVSATAALLRMKLR